MSNKVTLEALGLSNASLEAIGKLSETNLTPGQISLNIKNGTSLAETLPSFTGSISVKIESIYSLTVNIALEVSIKEAENKISKLLISGKWDGSESTPAWTEGTVKELIDNDNKITVSFSKSNSDAYILFNSLDKINQDTIVSIDKIMTDCPQPLDLIFKIDALSNIDGITIDSTDVDNSVKTITEKAVFLDNNNINLKNGNVFYKTITENTSFTISNEAAVGEVNSFILELTNAGSAIIAWWDNIRWAKGTAPSSLTADGVDILGFYTRDGGLNWRGVLLSGDSR